MEEVTVVRTGTFRETALGSKPFGMLVGAPGFEPGTSCAQVPKSILAAVSQSSVSACVHEPFEALADITR